MQQQKTKPSNKPLIITIGLIVILIVVGYFSFQSWQNQTEVVETINANNNTSQNTNVNATIIKKRPTLEKSDPDMLSIPDRNIEAPVVFITQGQNTQEGHQDALVHGVVHYPGTALPGEFGNPYIFGHSSDFFWKPGEYKDAFKDLIDIPVDTIVRITNSDGELFIFKVVETKIVGPKDVSVLDQFNNEKQMLTLQTSYPLGTALKRFIAVCEIDELATYGPAE